MSAPPPSSPSASTDAETGILSKLYQHVIGPINTDYYLRQFARFETLGRTVTTWNTGAACCTLAWFALRRLWRPAAFQAAALLGLGLIGASLHEHVSMAVQMAIALLGLLALSVIPGMMANGIYYHAVRGITVETMQKARTLAQAQSMLKAHAVTPQRLKTVMALQAAVVVLLLLLAGAWVLFREPSTQADEPQTAMAVGPPVLNFPPLQQPLESQPDAPAPADATPSAMAEPTTVTEPETSAASATAVAVATSAAVSSGVTTAINAATTAGKGAAAAAPQPPALPDAQPVFLNIGNYANAAQANDMERRLRQAQLPVQRHTIHSNKGELIRLRAGPFDSPAQADAAQRSLEKLKQQESAPVPVQPAQTNVANVAKATEKNAVREPSKRAEKARDEKPRTEKTATTAKGRFYLSAGVYAQKSNADNVERILRNAGLPVQRQNVSGRNGELTRMRAGPFETREQAQNAQRKIQGQKLETSIFQQRP